MKTIHQKMAVIFLAGFLVGTLTTVGFAQELQYVGNKKCVGCHRAELKAWQGDYHAKALDDLMPGIKAAEKTKCNLDPEKDYTAEASCLRVTARDTANRLPLTRISPT